MKYIILPDAVEDFAEIVAWLTENRGAPYALDIEEELFLVFDRLGDFPGLGHPRRELTDKPVLFLTHKWYLIIYEPPRAAEAPVLIHSVIHSSRDVSSVLSYRV